jgi:RNA polymerase sigma factor (sigma-70 family)
MSTWLTRIVINAARMQLRRRRGRPTVSLDEALNESSCMFWESLSHPDPTPEKALENYELRELALSLIGELPPSQRATLQLHRRDDFSIRMAADTLGVPEGTIKAQLTRGRANLSERFQQVTRRTKRQTAPWKMSSRIKVPSFRYGKGRTEGAGAGNAGFQITARRGRAPGCGDSLT